MIALSTDDKGNRERKKSSCSTELVKTVNNSIKGLSIWSIELENEIVKPMKSGLHNKKLNMLRFF